MGIHAKPSDAPQEIDYLTDVYDAVKSMWNLEVHMLKVDFHKIHL